MQLDDDPAARRNCAERDGVAVCRVVSRGGPSHLTYGPVYPVVLIGPRILGVLSVRNSRDHLLANVAPLAPTTVALAVVSPVSGHFINLAGAYATTAGAAGRFGTNQLLFTSDRFLCSGNYWADWVPRYLANAARFALVAAGTLAGDLRLPRLFSQCFLATTGMASWGSTVNGHGSGSGNRCLLRPDLVSIVCQRLWVTRGLAGS